MRDIKFRGFNADGWHEGSLMRDRFQGCHISYGLGDLTVPVLAESVGQFTGLVDEKGTPIYEGDVVEYPSDDGAARAQIVFGDVDDESVWLTGFRLQFICELPDKDGTVTGMAVVGNIHENPELLEASA